jgi:ribosomal protein S27AE
MACFPLNAESEDAHAALGYYLALTELRHRHNLSGRAQNDVSALIAAMGADRLRSLPKNPTRARRYVSTRMLSGEYFRLMVKMLGAEKFMIVRHCCPDCSPIYIFPRHSTSEACPKCGAVRIYLIRLNIHIISIETTIGN